MDGSHGPASLLLMDSDTACQMVPYAAHVWNRVPFGTNPRTGVRMVKLAFLPTLRREIPIVSMKLVDLQYSAVEGVVTRL